MGDYLSEQTKAILGIDPDAGAVDYKGVWTSWGDLDVMVRSLLAEYRTVGLGDGAGVGCVMRNDPTGIAMVLAAAVGGTAVLTINPAVHDDKLVADIAALRPPVVVAGREDWGRPGFRAAVEQAGAVGIRLEVAGVSREVEGLASRDAGDAPIHPGVLVYMLTSGTTGPPKRIPLDRVALADTIKAALEHEGGAADGAPRLQSGTRLMSSSIVHMGGLWEVFAAVLTGRAVSIMDKFSVAEWRNAVVRHRPKVCLVAPAGLRMILDADLPQEDLSSLIALRTGSAPLEVAIIDEFERRYGLPVLQTYGATEFAGVVAGWSLKDWRTHGATRKDSVGRLYPNVGGRVVDPETGRELPPGEEGLLELSLANDDQWMRTTDLAVIDDKRFLWIKGRVDNAINRGGFKVLPEEIAAVLLEHPGVRDACIVSLPDRRLGAVPAAAVARRAEQPAPEAAELKDWVRARMPPYKVPVAILVLDDLPRTPSMKPSVAAIRDLFEQTADGVVA